MTIRTLREQAGLSVPELAKRCTAPGKWSDANPCPDWWERKIRRLERDTLPPIGISTKRIVVIANALNCTTDALLGRERIEPGDDDLLATYRAAFGPAIETTNGVDSKLGALAGLRAVLARWR